MKTAQDQESENTKEGIHIGLLILEHYYEIDFDHSKCSIPPVINMHNCSNI